MVAVDSHLFDRLVKSFAGITPRRAAVRTAAAVGLGVFGSRLGAVKTRAKGKKRCRKNAKVCGGRKKCCGDLRCELFGNQECVGVALLGKRCCAPEGVRCDPEFGEKQPPAGPQQFGNCSCCAGLWCGQQTDGSFRCQTEDT